MSEAKKPPPTDALPSISKAQLEEHNGENGKSVWVAIHGFVCDVTDFIGSHPGGAKPLQKYAGKDGTQAFEALYHSEKARKMIKPMIIGRLDKDV